MSIPQVYFCPITHEVMTDPVIGSDGITYERSAITYWLSKESVSPMTKQPMSLSDLKPNLAIKELIASMNGIPQLAQVIKPTVSKSERNPVNIVCVVDTSGSMGELCKCAATDNSCENSYLTRLKLAQHAVRTVAESLTDSDKLSIIEFNSSATPLTGLLDMNKKNLDLSCQKIDGLTADGGTNIWDAIRVTIELVKASKCNEKVHILLFTDGESNDDPPRGIIPTLTDYLVQNSSVDISISTFGFSNNINSTLLFNISKLKNGIFNFIPDGSMIGTVFINTLSYIMTQRFKPSLTSEQVTICDSLVDILKTDDPSIAPANLMKFVDSIKPLSTSFTDDLILDCSDNVDDSLGQIYKAFNPRYYCKWGKHYIYSVISALNNRLCLNFKDKGVQHFKTPEFEKFQRIIENVFTSIQPPKPISGGPISSQQFTQTFYNSSGGCFLGGTLIKAIGEDEVCYMDVASVLPGTVVITHKGLATVKCVLKLKYSGPICRIGSTAITEFHPVFFSDEQWIYPGESDKFRKDTVNDVYVYDFVLDQYHTVKLFNLYAVTLNHGFTAPVVQHDYFGTELVLDDLMKHPGWANGYIKLDTCKFVRGEDNKVIRLDF
jgi:hypothetical protein